MSMQQATDIAQVAFGDFEHELANTRKVLERVPADRLTWKPHEKSRSLGELAQHVASLPWLFKVGVTEDHMDAAAVPPPGEPRSRDEILATFDARAADARAAFAQITPDLLAESWELRVGERVYFTMPKSAVLRTFALSHLIHHRGGLIVYLRLLNVPVPGLYGPSADEK